MGVHSVEKKQLFATGMLQKVRSVFDQVPEPPRAPQGIRPAISLSEGSIPSLSGTDL